MPFPYPIICRETALPCPNLGDINISTGAQKPGFCDNISLQPTDSVKTRFL